MQRVITIREWQFLGTEILIIRYIKLINFVHFILILRCEKFPLVWPVAHISCPS